MSAALIGQLVDRLAERISFALFERLGADERDGDDWLDSRHAAEYLGVHRDTLRKLAAERAISSEQDGPGCKLYFRRSDLDAWRRCGGRPRHLAASARVEGRPMKDERAAPRRVRVERNIYRRPSGVFEVGFKDGGGRQRWRTVNGGITAARAIRDELLAGRARGERVAAMSRLRFADAASAWLQGPVADLRSATRDCYRNAVEQHLMKRFGTRRLDAIVPDDLAELVRELRVEGLAESTIVIALGVTNRIYRYSARRLGWSGTNPVLLMLPSERPEPSQDVRRRLFKAGELEQTVRAAGEPYRTLFTLAALTGARLSELLALRWSNLRLTDLNDAEVEFAYQVDRRGPSVRPKPTGRRARSRFRPNWR